MAVAVATAISALFVPGTSGAFTASIRNSSDNGVIATRFSCADTFNATANKANAYFEYQLTQNAATTTDSSNAGNTGTFQGGHPTDASSPIACPNDTSGPAAYRLDGATNYLTTQTAVSAPPVSFSLAIWFKTTVAGGYLIGLAANQTGSNTVFDRHLYLNASGQLVFGTYSGAFQLVTSTSSYNDGIWHQAVATMSPSGGMSLYVDGAKVAGNTGYTSAEADSGYWRIGWNSITTWPGAPSNPYFSGSIRFAAAYTVALASGEIALEYGNGRPA
ncbi:MAG: LamG domain-containing protein [Actinomycetota bacterium]|nr:LamG domain-containing protein [Actinomycetota bacterium]